MNPARRNSRRPFEVFAAVVTIFIAMLSCLKPSKEIGVQVFLTAASVLAAVMVRQCCYLVCELHRLRVKSASNAWHVLVQCAKLPFSAWLVFGLCFVCSFLSVKDDIPFLRHTFASVGYVHFLVALVTMLCVWEAPEMELLYHRSRWGPTQVGENLAWAFALSYLHVLVDPCSRLHDRSLCSLRDRMIQYEQDNEVKLAVHKLVILMPASCYIEPELGSGGDDDIEVANPMDDLVVSRAGTRKRSYTNTVYKIRNGSGESPYYVVAEGATPLLTLNDMRECGELTSEQQREQMTNFCDKIRELMEANAACRSRFLLLQYQDTNEDGSPVPVSSVLRNAIRKELGLC
ncbi:stimulator of interferon genes protein-like isoform X1 [Haemaphysalis longicornis]